MEINLFLGALILFPSLGSVLCLAIPHKLFRNTLIITVTAAMITAAGMLTFAMMNASGGHLTLAPSPPVIEVIGWVIKAVDLTVLLYVIFRGVKAKRYTSPALAAVQLLSLVIFEAFAHIHETPTPITIDYLSLILILLASVIGPLILLFAIGYMDSHEAHLGLKKSRQPRFFAILLLFLGVMNALAVSDNMLWIYTFWEVTTLCSFLLISHDLTEESIKNAYRTLDLNMLGGVAFIWAIIALYSGLGTVSLSEITQLHLSAGYAGALAVGVALLSFSGFTKSAQFPFQSWLLGAMVAPTPVSALLHSSTMVKAGVYIIVRLSPVVSGSLLGNLIALAGGFTFLAASAIAISQQNGKRVLAYSTIANLGLIICCAGIGTHAALGAAMLLIIFHAISKGLLFLCIGTIEVHIHSRDIEDMQGLFKRMPVTTFITVIGMLSMLLPPFGVLITKWLAIESAVHLPVVLMLIILGSAFTVVFWSKWIGIILTMSYKEKYHIEHLKLSVSIALFSLLTLMLFCSCAVGPLFTYLIEPQLAQTAVSQILTVAGGSGGLWLANGTGLAGGVAIGPLFLLVFALSFSIPYFFRRSRKETVKPPYFGGELAHNDIRGIEFIGPKDKIENIVMHNYYMTGTFGEKNLSICSSLIAIAIILMMFGVTK